MKKWESGRPPKFNWERERETLQKLITAGEGLLRIAKRYQMTAAGIRLVLKRLGLRTNYQQ